METTTYNVTVTRRVYNTSTPFDVVVERLRRETNAQGLAESKPFIPSTYAQRVDKASFSAMCNSRLGRSEFMYFFETDYGSWMNLFGVGEEGQKAKRFIIGNPLIAATIIRHDLDACLAVPVELLVKQTMHGSRTEVIFNLPSSLILTAHNAANEDLLSAATALDAKLEELVKHVVHETNA